MLINPIISANSKTNNQLFKGKTADLEKFFSSQKVKEELGKIQTDADAKNVFLGLSVLAGSILAEIIQISDKFPEIKNFAEKILNNLGLKDKDKLNKEMTGLFTSVLGANNESKEIPENKSLVETNPNRNKYLAVLTNYPNLHKQYQKLLQKAANEPNNENNKFVMETIELLFEQMTKDNHLQYYESYFETLDSDYSDKLDDVAATIINAYRNGIQPLSYMQILNNKVIVPNEVTKWAKAKNLSFEEFLKCKFLSSNILSNLSDLKVTNQDFKITSMWPFNNYKIPMYTFKLHFKYGLPLERKLKAIADVHSAIYGPISLNDEQDYNDKYIDSDIRTELTDNILKDRRLDCVYNFVKYLNPDALKDIKLTNEEVKFLPKESETYKKIKEICSKEIYSLDEENPRLFELYEIMQDKNIFENLFTTTHSKLRFITRFVLKNHQNSQRLGYKCKFKASTLRKELDLNLHNYSIRCFVSPKGFAPQFYNYNSKLGNYVKITLNSSGKIHTIYEDFGREVKDLKNTGIEQ